MWLLDICKMVITKDRDKTSALPQILTALKTVQKFDPMLNKNVETKNLSTADCFLNSYYPFLSTNQALVLTLKPFKTPKFSHSQMNLFSNDYLLQGIFSGSNSNPAHHFSSVPRRLL